jgi:2-dehydro-3-deoxyphosphogluconate aldolase/(4S)-4-hydroxy-2-oxoglutarate aldolase
MTTTLTRAALPIELQETPLVAIVRGRRGDHVTAVTDALVESGLRCLEVTLNTPGALDVLARADHSAAVWGAGTVLTVDEVHQVADAGGRFCVAPVVDEQVGAACHERGLGWYPGAATPTEILRAWNLGATAVKAFPATSLGGPSFLKEVLAPLDQVLIMPTGGVNATNAADYLRAGAVAVGLGGSLIGDALDTGDVDALAARAATALAAVRAA